MAGLERAAVLERIDTGFSSSPIILTLGGIAREMLAVVGRKPNHFVSLDAMGQTVALGLGVALGREMSLQGQKVVAVEGDGSFIMGLSVMSTIGHLKPRNLVVCVLDNGVYLATGGQPTAAADLDMAGVARACGWAWAVDVGSEEELCHAVELASSRDGPGLMRILVGTAQIPTDYYLEDPVLIAAAFRRWLDADTP